MDLSQNVKAVQERIAAAATAAGRSPEEVALCATWPIINISQMSKESQSETTLVKGSCNVLTCYGLCQSLFLDVKQTLFN